MFVRDVEMFIEYCENKRLAAKTIGSYEQTLRLLALWLDEQGITQTEKITHAEIMGARWKVTEVQIDYPRLTLTLGGLYNGGSPTET